MLDKAGERVVLLACGAGTYIGCEDNVKCEWITKWSEDNTRLIRRQKLLEQQRVSRQYKLKKVKKV